MPGKGGGKRGREIGQEERGGEGGGGSGERLLTSN